MGVQGQVELLQALLAVVTADGVISRGEKGMYSRIAQLIGVGATSLDAMVDRAMNDPNAKDELMDRVVEDPERAMKLLIAAARVDGDIHEREREVLVQVMVKLGISVERFGELYEEALALVDSLRQRRTGG